MTIGIIGAMDIEVKHLVSKLENGYTMIVAGMRFAEGYLNGTPVVIGFCNVGKVNAAVCVQVMVDRFDVTRIINTGVAGSLDPRINIGDIVVSTDAVQHDMDVANLGYAVGQVPGLPTYSFAAEKEMRDIIIEAAHEVAPHLGVYEGRVASGDQFIRDDETKQNIIDEFGAVCTEMEGAAIAQVCYLNDIPYVIVRAISDKADGSDAQNYDEFEAAAAKNCALITERAVARMRY